MCNTAFFNGRLVLKQMVLIYKILFYCRQPISYSKNSYSESLVLWGLHLLQYSFLFLSMQLFWDVLM